MWKALLPLPLLLLACNSTESPEMKKVSLKLKETCAKGAFYSVGEEPSNWYATVEDLSPAGVKTKGNISLGWEPRGFRLPCSIGPDGREFVLTINYD